MKTLIKSACKLSVIFIVITDFNGQNNLDLIKFFNMKESFSIRFFYHIAIFIQPHFQLYVLPFFHHYFFEILCFRSTHLLSSLFIQCSVVAVFFCMCFCFRAMSDESQWIVYTEYSFKLHLKKNNSFTRDLWLYFSCPRHVYIFFVQSIFGIAISHESIFNNTFLEDFHFTTFSLSSCEHQWLSFYDEFIYSNGISVKFYFDYNRHDKWTRYWIEWESNMENSSIQRVQCQLELNSYTSSDWIQYDMRANNSKKKSTLCLNVHFFHVVTCLAFMQLHFYSMKTK